MFADSGTSNCDFLFFLQFEFLVYPIKDVKPQQPLIPIIICDKRTSIRNCHNFVTQIVWKSYSFCTI